MHLKTVVVLLITMTCTSIQAQIGVSSQPIQFPQEVMCTNMDLLKQVPCPDSTLFFEEGQGLVQQQFNAKDFSKLDKLFDQWCTGKDRFPDGTWKLAQYERGLRTNFEVWNIWDKDLRVIQTWQKTNPDSAAALFSEAVYWHAYAWKARGGGYASTVAKEGWELFRERLLKAETALASSQAANSRCPAPQALRITLLIELGADKSTLDAAYSAAAQKHSEYHQIHFAMARHYDPKWGGSVAAYENFASRVAELTKSFEGTGMYARIFWLVDRKEGGIPFRNDLKTPPFWNKLKVGYEDLMQRYPSSLHNLGKYADVACRSSESALYKKLRDKIVGYESATKMVDPIDVCDKRHNWVAAKN